MPFPIYDRGVGKYRNTMFHRDRICGASHCRIVNVGLETRFRC